MQSEKGGEATISIDEPKTDAKEKGIAPVPATAPAPAPVVASKKAAQQPRGGWRKGLAIFDFVLRLCAITASLAATAVMATTQETLPFFTQFFQFQAQYNDLPTLTYFVVANAIASGYLVLSLPFSIVCIIRPQSPGPRLLLIVFDTVVTTLTISAASAAADTVYLAHNGNSSANWNAICQQFNDFCHQTSIAVVASFIASLIFAILIILSAFALKRN
ncbi:hypothetical protein K2173_013949 [Erythroxylum novogranatense]|uniref:CASP-like protein n=1 Tax=Erythroxylum novogranatense TaxID=1862640 RepID=A0AAV8SDB9_9ROSI|nr:hypothetical protein K2173_013949 [Erythroxylum novogranatense]